MRKDKKFDLVRFRAVLEFMLPKRIVDSSWEETVHNLEKRKVCIRHE